MVDYLGPLCPKCGQKIVELTKDAGWRTPADDAKDKPAIVGWFVEHGGTIEKCAISDQDVKVLMAGI